MTPANWKSRLSLAILLLATSFAELAQTTQTDQRELSFDPVTRKITYPADLPFSLQLRNTSNKSYQTPSPIPQQAVGQASFHQNHL
jgi:hypothetical protein